MILSSIIIPVTLCILELTNLARGRPAYQSSTDEGGVASRAVDGNTNSNWNSKTCTHTEHGRGNWWEVDLGKAVYVSKVSIDLCDLKRTMLHSRIPRKIVLIVMFLEQSCENRFHF